MKKLILIPILLSTLILTWCWNTDQELYDEVAKWCTMTWYTVNQWQCLSGRCYYCKEPITRQDRFGSCAYNCDQAIDDVRDNVWEQSSVNQCLKICMWE